MNGLSNGAADPGVMLPCSYKLRDLTIQIAQILDAQRSPLLSLLLLQPLRPESRRPEQSEGIDTDS